MARNQTEYCQLSQWDASDQVLRTEFNGDNAKIDAALAAMSEEVSGKAEVSALAVKADVAALEEVGKWSGQPVDPIGVQAQGGAGTHHRRRYV